MDNRMLTRIRRTDLNKARRFTILFTVVTTVGACVVANAAICGLLSVHWMYTGVSVGVLAFSIGVGRWRVLQLYEVIRRMDEDRSEQEKEK